MYYTFRERCTSTDNHHFVDAAPTIILHIHLLITLFWSHLLRLTGLHLTGRMLGEGFSRYQSKMNKNGSTVRVQYCIHTYMRNSFLPSGSSVLGLVLLHSRRSDASDGTQRPSDM